MSAAIGASAAGARAYTATASQGLLYMAEALYNASGLGLPIVMTLANRAIGAPINIWNDHSDSMSQRDSGWIQLYAESNQAAIDLHIQAFKLAEELSLPVMVCMDGFVLTHAVEPLEVPRRRTSTPTCRPTSRARCSTPTSPSRSGRWSDRRRSRRCATSPTQSRCRRSTSSRRSRPSSPRRSAVRPAGSSAATAPRAPTRSSSRSGRCSARSRTSSTSCGRGHPDRRARNHLFPALPARRDPRGALGSAPRDRRRACLRRRRRRHRRAERPPRARRPAAGRLRRRRRARGPTGHPALAPRTGRRRARGPDRAEPPPLPRHGLEARRARAGAPSEKRRSGPHAENILRDVGVVAGRSH